MGELSFLTIIVSLAVCSLLVYAVFQYMKVRLTILEQSHKEQAMILQQYIEESATDIHRLYKLTTNGSSPPQGSIILEYADANANANANANESSSMMKQSAYNEPHLIHLDTAMFQNNRNLIEISSDSEDTTDTESETDSESDTESETDSDNESECHVNNNNNREESDSEEDDNNSEETNNDTIKPTEDVTLTEVAEIVMCDNVPEIKLVTVDLGVNTQEMVALESVEQPPRNDVLSMLYKKAQQEQEQEQEQENENEKVIVAPTADVTTTATTTTAAITITSGASLTSLSVSELRQLLKEKYKHHPEKHAEIQKLKKVELIYALQNL